MKTREELIEEMAKDLEEAKYYAIGTVGSLNNGFGGWYGEYMYKKGYRKQSDTAREILKPLYDCIIKHPNCCVNLSEDIKFLMETYGVEEKK